MSDSLRTEPPRGPRAFEPRSRTRETILASLRRLLRERPLESLRMDDLANACGLSRRTIYNQFTDLDEAHRVCFEQLIQEVARDARFEVPIILDPKTSIALLAISGVRVFRDERYVDIRRQVLRNNDRHRWLGEACDRQIKQPLFVAIENSLLYHQRAFVGLDVRALATRLVSLLESYAVWPLLTGATPDDGDDAHIAGMATGFITAQRGGTMRRRAGGSA